MEVEIEDNTHNHIDLYRVVKRNDANTFIPTDITINNDSGLNWLKTFQINPALDMEGEYEYREHNVFLEPFYGDWMDVNHTVIFDIPTDTNTIKINDENFDVSVRDREVILESLNNNWGQYIWIVSDPIPEMRVIGIYRFYGETEDSGQPFIRSLMYDVNHTFRNIPNALFSFRFHPFMHTLVPLTDDIIGSKDLVYAIPYLGHSRDIEVRNWVFENKTTGDVFESYLTSKRYYEDGRNHGDFGTIEDYGGTQGWFITPQESMKLKPGYYNIKLQYRKGETLQEFVINSAFLLEK